MIKKEFVYPKSWNDDDIIRYKYYFNEGKKMYDMPDDLITLCCVQQINEEKGLVEPINYEAIKDIKDISSNDLPIENISIEA
jgi:hypothetical protein